MTYIIKYKETNGKGDCYFKNITHEKYNYIEFDSMEGTRLKSMAKVYNRKGYADKIAQKLVEEYGCKDVEVVECKEFRARYSVGDKVSVEGTLMTIKEVYIDPVLDTGDLGKVIYYFEESLDGCYEEELGKVHK